MQTFRPKMIICGASAYPRDFDYERFRKIADSVGAYLLCDMAHVSGLVSAQLLKSPFELCDVVTTTTHKSLRGPRAGAQFCLLCRLPWLHCMCHACCCQPRASGGCCVLDAHPALHANACQLPATVIEGAWALTLFAHLQA